MSEGIKELKEVVIGANELALVLMKHLKDGFQAGKDIPALVNEMLSNEPLKAAISAAYDNVQKVPAEAQDLSVAEIVELVMVQGMYAPKLIDAMK